MLDILEKERDIEFEKFVNKVSDSISKIVKISKYEENIDYEIITRISASKAGIEKSEIEVNIYSDENCDKKEYKAKYIIHKYGYKLNIKVYMKLCKNNNLFSIINSTIKKYGGERIEYS